MLRVGDSALCLRPRYMLGHVVGNGTVHPEESKIEGVWSFPTPTTKKELCAFLGLTGYYRKFIKDYLTIALPLTDLTRKCKPNVLQWTKECVNAFDKLKHHLRSSPILKSPDFDRDFVLQTDASDRGVGAVLSQTDQEGVEHPVAYFSRKLLPREEKYSTVEKECLAIKLGIQNFRVYLLGRPFTVETDHHCLEWFDHLKENNARLTRWSLALQPYAFKVVYRKAKRTLILMDYLEHFAEHCQPSAWLNRRGMECDGLLLLFFLL